MSFEASTSAIYEARRASVKCLTMALHARDVYTRFHCDRVVTLALGLGANCGLDQAHLDSLCKAALFHDIGKIGVPDVVLHKPGRLNEDEWVSMKAHSELGEQLFLATGHECAEAVSLIIRHHHEHFDGGGYPDGLTQDAIPLSIRVLLIADAYDAMISPRPYHIARSHHEVMEVLESESGWKLDPDVFRAFSRTIGNSSAKGPRA